MPAHIFALSHKARFAWSAISLPVITCTIFLSAFLLFSVQPFFAKMVLPSLGGSPAVWSVAMVFFQAMLLAGYAYAHAITRLVPFRIAALLHIIVMLSAFLVLPVAIPQGWTEPPQTGQTFWLLTLFGLAAGLPFFAVSANGPLLQAWFSRTGHPHAEDPYFLYGASNIGSFASLILYIVAIEPLLSLGAQSLAWTIGFTALLCGIGISAYIVFRSNAGQQIHRSVAGTEIGAISGRMRARWMALAAVPSGLLVAVTAHISTDIAAAPFLWVIPLALFLLTFVFAFARKPVFSISLLSRILPALAAFVFISMVLGKTVPIWLTLGGHLVFFFFAALLAHSVLVAHRPAASDLTGFYFWMSLGGVLGGAFTTLLSPALFDWVAEYPLLIIAALFCGPSPYEGNPRQLRILVMIAAIAVLLMNNPWVTTHLMPPSTGFYGLAIAAFAMVSAVCALRSQVMHLFFVLLVGGLYFSMQSASTNLHAQRSFFGVVRALETADGKFTVMAHGTTEHGAMRNSDEGRRPIPLAYYHHSGGIASALFAAQKKIAGNPAEIGIVGLGTGSLLCHRKPNERWTNFEIDKAVVDIASDPELFGFVSQCGNGDPIILGDARLTLAKQPENKFDYLLIDAFSSDSIPVHLLTREALELYRSRITPGGLLVFHISNRYMELQSVLAAIARESGMIGRTGIFQPSEQLRKEERVNPSEVVVLASSESALGSIVDDERWNELDPMKTTPWTDDYSNILAAIWRNF